jgi:23S rRNA pseudouridine955/2504/2580 synthase
MSQRITLRTNTQKYINFYVDENAHEQRIDNFLFRQYKKVPKSRIYRLLRSRNVKVNKKRVNHLYKLQCGDVINLPNIIEQQCVTTNHKPSEKVIQLLVNRIIYEDDDLLIINKPSGIATHGGSGISFGVIELLRAARPNAKSLELVHRLDRETSGVLVIAKKRSILRTLHEQIRNHQIKKQYLLLVRGQWRDKLRKINYSLHKNCLRGGERVVAVADDGKKALTIFRLRSNFVDATLLEAELGTGRTHQIRVHAAAVGYPIAGDKKYGDKTYNKMVQQLGLQRLFLHASVISFTLPNGKVMNVQAPLDEELKNVLAKLRKIN